MDSLRLGSICPEKKSLMDYKFYCFNGKPRFLYISKGLENHDTACISFVNLDWTFAPYHRSDYKPFDILPPKPGHFEEMLALCRKLSAGISFLRCDFYEVNGHVYFSELTFSPCSGFMPLSPKEADMWMGDLINLPGKKGECGNN